MAASPSIPTASPAGRHSARRRQPCASRPEHRSAHKRRMARRGWRATVPSAPRFFNASTSRSALRLRPAGSAATFGMARKSLNRCVNSGRCAAVYRCAASAGVCPASVCACGAMKAARQKRRRLESMATVYLFSWLAEGVPLLQAAVAIAAARVTATTVMSSDWPNCFAASTIAAAG